MTLADLYHVPVYTSLAVIVAALGAAIGASLLRSRSRGRGQPTGASAAGAEGRSWMLLSAVVLIALAVLAFETILALEAGERIGRLPAWTTLVTLALALGVLLVLA